MTLTTLKREGEKGRKGKEGAYMHGSGDAALAKCCCQDVPLNGLSHLLSSHLNMHTAKLMTRANAPPRGWALALAGMYIATIRLSLVH